MAFFIENNVYQGTASSVTPVVSAPIYESRGLFSLNASNELQSTFWLIKNGELVESDLGLASYEVYDKNGNTVGLSQSGINPNINSQFISSPILANIIQDLTHYVVKVTISSIDGNHVGYLGITLGE